MKVKEVEPISLQNRTKNIDNSFDDRWFKNKWKKISEWLEKKVPNNSKSTKLERWCFANVPPYGLELPFLVFVTWHGYMFAFLYHKLQTKLSMFSNEYLNYVCLYFICAYSMKDVTASKVFCLDIFQRLWYIVGYRFNAHRSAKEYSMILLLIFIISWLLLCAERKRFEAIERHRQYGIRKSHHCYHEFTHSGIHKRMIKWSNCWLDIGLSGVRSNYLYRLYTREWYII